MQYNNIQKFNEVYERYITLIYRITFSILQNEENAKDATQECCIRLYRNMALFQHKDKAELKTLISIISRNVAIDLYRKVKRQESRETLLIEQSMMNYENQIDSIIQEESFGDLQKYVNMLKPIDADILTLRYYFEYPFKQIGKLLKITENNAKVRVFRAKQKLVMLIEGGKHHE